MLNKDIRKIVKQQIETLFSNNIETINESVYINPKYEIEDKKWDDIFGETHIETYEDRVFSELYNLIAEKYGISEKNFPVLDKIEKFLKKLKLNTDIKDIIKEKKSLNKPSHYTAVIIEDNFNNLIDQKIKKIFTN